MVVRYHNLHPAADIVLVIEKLGDHSVQLRERSGFLCRFALVHEIIVRLTKQSCCVTGFGGELMNVLHTLADILQNLVPFDVQQIVVGRFHLADQFRQLSDAVIRLRHGKDRRNLTEDFLRVGIHCKVVPLFADFLHLTPGFVIDGALGLEEQLHALHVFDRVQKVVLFLHHTGEKSHVVLALAQHIGCKVMGGFHNFPFRVSHLLIGFQKLIVVLLFFLEGVQHETDQPVFVGGDVHCTEVIPEEVNALSHQIFRGGNPTGYDRLVDL